MKWPNSFAHTYEETHTQKKIGKKKKEKEGGDKGEGKETEREKRK